MPATGGIITTDGLYTVHTFDTPGNHSIIFPNAGNISLLVVGAAGGTGGGVNGQFYWGGGGGGKVNYWASLAVTLGSKAIVVGNKGYSPYNGANGGQGETSSFNVTNSAIGGYGGYNSGTSHGGASGSGNAGDGTTNRAGGGGEGQAAPNTGRGGNGITNSISGASVYYGGGEHGDGFDASYDGLGYRANGIVIVRYLTSDFPDPLCGSPLFFRGGAALG